GAAPSAASNEPTPATTAAGRVMDLGHQRTTAQAKSTNPTIATKRTRKAPGEDAAGPMATSAAMTPNGKAANSVGAASTSASAPSQTDSAAMPGALAAAGPSTACAPAIAERDVVPKRAMTAIAARSAAAPTTRSPAARAATTA